MNYADKMRRFADYLDDRPELRDMISSYSDPSISLYVDDWESFQATIRHLDGYVKDGYGGSLTAVHREYVDSTDKWDYVFTMSVSVSEVCEATPKLDENGEPVLRVKRKTVDTDEYEPVMEYKCPKVWTD
jgi:hypothetical protein